MKSAIDVFGWVLPRSRYRLMKRKCSTQMQYEKTKLNSFELCKEFSGTLRHFGLQLDSNFSEKTLAGPKFLQKTVPRLKVWAGPELDTMFFNKVELKFFHGSIIGLFISLLFRH